MLPSRYDKGVAMNTEQLRTPEQDCALQYSIVDRGNVYKATALPKDLVIVFATRRDAIFFSGVETGGLIGKKKGF